MMNYIEQELRRQREAMLRLLAGGASPPSGTEEPDETLWINKNGGTDTAAEWRKVAFTSPAEIKSGFEVRGGRMAQSEVLQDGIRNAETEAERRESRRLEFENADVPGESAWGAQMLSHVIERDARRYDGAYLLY